MILLTITSGSETAKLLFNQSASLEVRLCVKARFCE